MTLRGFLRLTLDHSQWQVSRVKQGTLTLPEHLVQHPLQGALIGCPLAWYSYFTHVFCLLIYDIDYRYWICLLVLQLFHDWLKAELRDCSTIPPDDLNIVPRGLHHRSAMLDGGKYEPDSLTNNRYRIGRNVVMTNDWLNVNYICLNS